MIVELTLYLGMGLAVFAVWSEVTAAFHPGALYLLFGGGAAYVLGVVFFVIGEKVRFLKKMFKKMCTYICLLCIVV
jgi:channel protein (hemolysin III family)